MYYYCNFWSGIYKAYYNVLKLNDGYNTNDVSHFIGMAETI